jgi:hypothetical protein
MRLSSTLMMTMAGILFSVASFSQSPGDYRSVNAAPPTGGNWGDFTKWEEFDGAFWLTSGLTPNSSNGVITIRTGDSIILNVAVTADQIVVEAGAVLVITQASNLTLNNGAGTDLVVNGRLYLGNARTISGAGNIVINGTFNWLDGTLGSVTTTSALSITNLSTNVGKNLSANFTNGGVFNWATGATAGGISFTNATFTNDGTINELFQSDRGFTSVSGTNSFVNNGTFNKTTTFGFFNNSVPTTNSATGVFKGLGSFNFNFGSLTNNGNVTPGLSPGLLSINAGAVSGQSATINIEILNGSGAGTGHDVLNLTTVGPFTTNLSTIDLVVTELPAGGGAPFQSYTILTTTGDFTGTFATATYPSGYDITYNATSVVVTKLSYPLPAVWGDFSALARNGNVQLSWTTLQESNTSYFEVEHSTNGRDYKTIASVPAAGNSSLVKTYSYAHSAASSQAANYYRIKLVDLDGKASRSSVRSVKFTKGAVVVVQATPNPVISNLQISVQETAVDINIIDMNGRLFKSLRNLQPGVHSVNVSELASGQYQLMIYQDNRMIQSQKIIKQ